MKKILYVCLILLLVAFCTGCGETVRGMSKDAHRVGRGVRTIFIPDE